MRALAFLLAFLSAHVGSVKVASSSKLTFDARDDKNRPVSKVISLIKEMLKQLEAEAAQDQEVYDKMACWCETNEKEKTKSIADAESRITDLTAKIEEYTALSTQLSAEIKQTEKEVADNQAALDKATSIREKQLAEFNDEEKDLTESISALKAALTVLGKHNSLLQLPRAHAQSVATTLQREMQRHSPLLKGALTHVQRRAAASFIQAPQDYFDAEPTFKQSYAPQSGEIYGILSQMKETFEENLAASQKEETEGQAAYDEVRKGKEEEIAAGQAQIDSKTQELAETDEKNANAKVDLDDTKASKLADEEFLAMLKEKCAQTDKEFEERQKTRSEEIEACSKALAILSGDDAHDLFTKTFNFVQKQAVTNSKSRQQASMVLSSAASRLHSPRLSALATSVRLDAFTKVKQAIDDMVEALLKEKADEIKHKDFCIEELNTNQLQTEKKDRKKADVEAKIEELTMTIKELTKALETLEAEIKELSVQLKRAGEDREIENKAFQETVADQRATQQLLKAALTVLEGYYGKAALIQQEPPPGFKEYKNNALSGGVMGLITQIIDDAKAAEAEAIRAEEDAQTAYETFVKETNAGIDAKTKDVQNKAEVKATTEQNLVEAEASKEEVVTELGVLSDAAAELHGACDFVLKNFDVRQTARDEEIQALRQAKAILSGAKFQEFLQRT